MDIYILIYLSMSSFECMVTRRQLLLEGKGVFVAKITLIKFLYAIQLLKEAYG
jgi:hypothetical protein